MLDKYIDKTIAEIVVSDYRTADVFKKHGLNYCCGGKIPFREACAIKNINASALIFELEEATRNIRLSNTIEFSSWSMEFLIDYIVNIHHSYLYTNLPLIETGLLSFVNSHKKQHPELENILAVFTEIASVLIQHNREEEEEIFPYIKQMANTFRRRETYGSLFVKTLGKPLYTFEKQHAVIADLLQEMRRLTNNYEFPGNACTNHQVMFRKLHELDNDLVQHKHLENNILFPKAIAMEQNLLQV